MSEGIAGSAVRTLDEALDRSRGPLAGNDQAHGRVYSGAAPMAEPFAEDLKLYLAPSAADDPLAQDLWRLAFVHC